MEFCGLENGKIKLTKFTNMFVTSEYIDWLNNFEINRYLYVGRIPITKDQIEVPNNNQNIRFAILASDNDGLEYTKYIGTISLHNIDWISRKAEIGYIIGNKDYWNKGIATMAVDLISNFALHRLNLNKLEAGVVDGNLGSVKVLEKNGFKRYCEIPEDYFVDGEFKNTIRFYKLQKWNI